MNATNGDPLSRGLDWLQHAALPLWTSAGWDEGAGMFVERLDLNGRPLAGVPRRVMVQARQIYVMAVACRRNWLSGADRFLDVAVRTMIRRYHAVDGRPGWAFSIGPHGDIDPRRDLYAHAFVLLALAGAFTLTGEPELRRLAMTTMSFLDEHLASPAGGYVESYPETDVPRRQNPHMHLFEALIAWHGADPDGGYLDLASNVLELLGRHFLKGRTPVLTEFFGANWEAPSESELSFEPGHHFEWAWLLERFSVSGGRSTTDLSERLLRPALRFGIDPSGLIFDEVSAVGRPARRSFRLWPHAEAAKAMTTAAARHSGAPSPEDFLEVLQRDFLDPAHPGSWIDHFESDGQTLSRFAPASSLYHLVCAYDTLTAEERPHAIPSLPS